MGTFYGIQLNFVLNAESTALHASLSLSLSLLQSEITSILNCQCLAIDLRGHGDSRVANESDLSAVMLAK